MPRLKPSAITRRRKPLGSPRPGAAGREKASIIGAIEPHEREAAAFWFRRITTTLLVGNGGGVIAVASYLSNAKDTATAAVLAYPALSYFLSGVLVTVCSYTVAMLWSGFRVEAYAKHYAQKLEQLRSIEKNRVKPKEGFFAELKREWNKAPTPAERDVGWFTLSFALLGVVQLGALVGAGWLFYAGASTVIAGAQEMLCRSQPNNEFCRFPPSVIFPARAALPDDSEDSADSGPGYMTVARYPVVASAEFEKLDGRSFWPSRITVKRDGVKRYTGGYVEVIVRLTDHRLGDECFLELGDYTKNRSSPYFVNPALHPLFRHTGSGHGGISLEPVRLDMTMIFDGVDNETHSWSESYDIQNGELSGTQQHYDVATRLLPSNFAAGGAYIFTPTGSEVDAECIGMAVQYGFELAEVTRRSAP